MYAASCCGASLSPVPVAYLVVLTEDAARLQGVRKIVPDPIDPTNGASSPEMGKSAG